MWSIGVMSGVLVGNLAQRFGLGVFVLEKLLLRENLKQGPVLNKLRGFILQIIEVLLLVSNLNQDESITRR
ncbi:MAG: hypothetical protein V7L21_26435 [Nostoc sp.]|uniref:hypothetical protein n=1 Tax=Nostoc sp. TaxID=1180 RepID=UPI002FFD4B38